MVVKTHSCGNHRDCRTRSSQGQGRHLCFSCSVWSVRKVVGKHWNASIICETYKTHGTTVSQQAKALLSPWTCYDREERDVVKKKQETKKCERQAELSKEELRVSSFEARFISF